LWIISICVKKYQQAFLAPLLGNGCCRTSKPSAPMYPCVLPFKKILFHFFLLQWSNLPFKNLFAMKDEFLERPPSKPIKASG